MELRSRLAALVLILAAGCDPVKAGSADGGSGPDGGGGGEPDAADNQRPDGGDVGPPDAGVVVPASRDLDVLFVIDNSGTMADEQLALATAFHNFVNTLENRLGYRPNLHLGVVSSDMGIGPYSVVGCSGDGDGGRLRSEGMAGCPTLGGTYIVDVDFGGGARETNYEGTIDEAFSCIARLGTVGCGFEQHLESMRRALDGSNPENDGFLRPDAFLAIVFVADEDDCSAADPWMFNPDPSTYAELGNLSSFRCTEYGVVCDGAYISRTVSESYGDCQPRGDSYIWHPSIYGDFLESLKSDPGRLIVAAIAGDPTPFAVTVAADGTASLDPSCVSSSGGTAVPAVRFLDLLEKFPGRSGFHSICNDDLAAPLANIADLIANAMSGGP